MINAGARFDWAPYTSSFIVRMLTSTHDICTELVVREIWSQLESVTHGDKSIAAIVDLVTSEATSVSVRTWFHQKADIPSTHQTPPLHTPIINIPPLLSRPLTHSNTKTWRGWLMITYAVPTETSAWNWGSILNTALGPRGRRFPPGDLD